jgi:hypothetical protein
LDILDAVTAPRELRSASEKGAQGFEVFVF